MIYTGKFELKWLTEHTLFKQVDNNNKFLSLTERESAVKSARPKFVYMHVYMPHPPYYFDSKGNLKDEATVFKESSELSLKAYLEYIPYTNSRIKEVISEIKKNTNGNAVIVFMGDHGFRYPTKELHPDQHFQNQNAIYFPDHDYHLLYDSISGVNQFRVVFNKLFKQNIPLLKDSAIFLQDKQ
jgi:phosphoglycerol transferase MdoB-like AlkP superfamily enzyme